MCYCQKKVTEVQVFIFCLSFALTSDCILFILFFANTGASFWISVCLIFCETESLMEFSVH